MSQDLSVDDVAPELQLHPNTVRQLVAAGYFPGAFTTGKGGVTSPGEFRRQDLMLTERDSDRRRAAEPS